MATERPLMTKRRLVIDEYAGRIVQSIFGMYKEGMSISAIADRLNSMGVLSPMEYRLFLGDSYKTLFKNAQRGQVVIPGCTPNPY